MKKNTFLLLFIYGGLIYKLNKKITFRLLLMDHSIIIKNTVFMRLKWKRKDWLFSGFIVGLILVPIWLVVLFTDTADKSTFQKIGQWMMLLVFISNSITFYLGYKIELKRGKSLQNNKPGF